MKNSIKGEESNTFSNTLGETICVEIKDTVEQTANLLNKVLCGDTTAAHLLALEVHQDMQLEDVDVSGVVDGVKIDFSKVGIWIDPIDSTAEYINGTEEPNNESIAKTGLKCVTVLIGAYCLKTGLPLAGVINQPFSFKNENNWFGRSYISSLPNKSNNTICVSTSEDEAVKTKLTSAGFILAEAAGAGYKLLAVATGLADAYVLSKNSTFKWDTCAPHAVLQAAGGDILVYSCALRGELLSVNYLTGEGDKITQCCNHGGIIAYRSKRSLKKILDALKM